jgi:hypothetical protein
MDLSKLPKLSNTPEHVPPPAQQPVAGSTDAPIQYERVVYATEPPGLAEAWISIGIGVILLLMNHQLFTHLFGGNVGTFSDGQGNPLTYTQTVFFRGDLALTLFALALILEGLIIALVRRPSFVLIAAVFTVLATIVNLIYLLLMMAQGYGLQLLAAFAVLFGGYIASYEWRVYQSLRATNAKSTARL